MEISKKTPDASRSPGNLPGGNGAHSFVELLEKARAGADAVLKELESQPGGLSEAEADARLKQVGTNEIAREKRQSALMRLLSNIRNPWVLLLLALGVLSYLTGDLRAMDVLCTDKTGTLTQGKIVLERHLDANGDPSELVLQYGYLNSFHHTGLKTLLDEAILDHEELEERLKAKEKYRKIDEIPCKKVGMPVEHLLLGSQIEAMSETELAEAASATSVFARLAPAHKERVIRALQSKATWWGSWATASTTPRP